MDNKNFSNPLYRKLFPTTYEKNLRIQEGLNFIGQKFKDGPKKEVLDLLYKDTNLETVDISEIR